MINKFRLRRKDHISLKAVAKCSIALYKPFILIFSIIALIPAIKAQTIITGKVVDAQSRQVLDGAYIKQGDNNNVKALSDHNGNFTIKLTTANAKLTASFIGYKVGAVLTAGRKNITIELQPAVINLSDVVLTQTSGQQKFVTLAKVDLDLKPVKNTQELLRIVPGLFVAQHAGGGKAEQIFLRGFDCDHGTDIQVSVDGLPVNMVSHAHGQGYADAHFIIPETINNIDYGTGPYYTQHGNLNTAGYINFSTYNNISQSRIQVEAGRFNTFRTLAILDLLKKNKDKQSAYVAGEFNYTDGPTINKQYFNRFNLFGKYTVEISSGNRLMATLSAFKSKWDASGQVPSRAVESGLIDRFGSIDPTEGGNTERYNASIILSHSFKNGSSLDNQLFYSRYKFNLFSNFTFFLNDPINGDQLNQAEARNILGYQSKFNNKHFYNNWSLNSTYGAGIRYDGTNNSQLAQTIKRKFLRNIKLGDISEANAFSYIQQQALAGKWLLDAGVRYDYFLFNYHDKINNPQFPSQSKGILSPKLNIQYTINKALQLYAKAGKGFHSNDTRVVVEQQGHQILPAAYGTDLGIILKPVNKLILNVAAWYFHLDQEFVYVGDDGNVEPSGKTRREGIDVIARYQFNDYLFVNANINYTRPRAIDKPKGADYIPLAPTLTSTGGIFYEKKEGFNGGLTYRYLQHRPANENNSIIAAGYFQLDGSVNYTKNKYEIGIAIENILNTEWNEAQFATTSRLPFETTEVSELNYTPGIPFSIRGKLAIFF
jgi:outer membrane cobalamin receptor